MGEAGVRDSLGELIHDDHLMVDALVSELDDLEWAAPTPTVIIAAPDPFSGMERAF